MLTTAEANAQFGEPRVRAQIAARRWTRPERGVVVLHNGPLTFDQLTWVRLLACAPGAVLGGLSAAHRDGLTGFASDETVVVLPDGARRPQVRGVVPHWSTYLDERDVHPDRHPPRTRIARSLVDAASWSDSERRSRAVVLAGAQQGLVRTSHLRDALSRRGACRHRALITESYLDAAGGIQSLPERDFEQIRLRRGIPEPSRQAPARRGDGRYYLDVEWRRFGLAAEIHGIPHMRVGQWDDDLMRANEIVIGGPTLLIFSSYAIRRTPDTVGDQLVRLFRNAGWRG